MNGRCDDDKHQEAQDFYFVYRQCFTMPMYASILCYIYIISVFDDLYVCNSANAWGINLRPAGLLVGSFEVYIR